VDDLLTTPVREEVGESRGAEEFAITEFSAITEVAEGPLSPPFWLFVMDKSLFVAPVVAASAGVDELAATGCCVLSAWLIWRFVTIPWSPP
jgi:hypothetical protein